MAKKIKITPEIAEHLLKHNNRLSRPMSQEHIDRMAEAIRNGEWRTTGDVIKISKDGELLDGRHRLWAIIKAGKPVEALIVQEQEKLFDVPLAERGFGVLDKEDGNDSK